MKSNCVLAVLAVAVCLASASGAVADIYNYQTGQVIPGTEGITPGPGINLSYWDTSSHNLRYAGFEGMDLHQSDFAWSWVDDANFSNANLTLARFDGATLTGADLSNANLTSATLGRACLTNANLSNANLTGADFTAATLTGVDLTGAVVAGAYFSRNLYGYGSGITKEQLYSTASYKARDLTGIRFYYNDLTGCNLAGQNLTGAAFLEATLNGADLSNANLSNADLTRAGFGDAMLSGADLSNGNLTGAYLTGADLRNANLTGAIFYWYYGYPNSANLADADLRGAVGADLSGATLHNTILPDGQIQGLALGSGETLCVRNSTVAITVSDTMTFDADSTLYLELEPNWTSTINVAEGVTPQLGGTLDLGLAEGVDPGAMIGDTFYLFNWNGSLTGGNHFDNILSDLGPNYVWDTSDLYNGGTVTLMTYGPQPVPEPGTIALIAPALLGFAGIAVARRRK